jgi:hypothetical protein
LLFATIHLLAGKLRFLEGIPRSRWLSMAGGVSVAYVFVHMLPELGEGQTIIREGLGGGVLARLESHIYLVALFGLVVFYGLERTVLTSRPWGKGSGEATPPGIFWIHLASFAVYNLIIGYLLLHREESSTWSLATYALAMGLHFVVNDFGLREHHKHRYHAPGRWILALAILAGWALGVIAEVSEQAVIFLFAFVAGGVVLNVLKEELPEERKSRFWAFALGCAVYASLVIIA